MQRPVSEDMPDTASLSERDKVNNRIRRFKYKSGLLYRVFTDGNKKEVPWPAKRSDIVMKSHDDLGHFRIKQTSSLVDTGYWRHGMYEQVRLDVRSYNTCARVKASFVPRDVVLHPLPITGMFYRWSVDLVVPFPQSELVMIEHSSKWVEVVAIPTKESFDTAQVFRQYVLCRYGAPV